MITNALKAVARMLNKNVLNPFVNANTLHKALYVGNGNYVYNRNLDRWMHNTPSSVGFMVHPYYYL